MQRYRAVIYALAIALGVMLAVPRVTTVGERPARIEPEQTIAVPSVVGDVSPSTPAPLPEATAIAPETHENRVFAASGVTLEAFRAGGEFIGYAVVRSHDPRLAVGDVVTSVNGERVEDSAAGGELLIAALRNPSAELALQPRTDWASADAR